MSIGMEKYKVRPEIFLLRPITTLRQWRQKAKDGAGWNERLN